MSQFKYEAKFSDGSVETRGSNREYTHAAQQRNAWTGHDGIERVNVWVTFHGTEAAARKGRFVVEVVEVVDTKAAKASAVTMTAGQKAAATRKRNREQGK